MFNLQKWLIFEENGTFEGKPTMIAADSYVDAQKKSEELTKETCKSHFVVMHRDEDIGNVFAKIKRCLDALRASYKYCNEDKQKEIDKFLQGLQYELNSGNFWVGFANAD